MIRIREIMSSPVITVSPRNSIQEALEIMRENDTRRLPVTDGGKLVGILVQHDIEKALRSPGRIPHTPVEWVMTKRVHYVSPKQTVTDAARLMTVYKISALPVIDSGNLVGIITDTDLLHLLIRLMEQKESD
ncbi:MAG: CBS domain-containing protein [Syntrophomonadaceae bacterium]|nr:CBS domain-containing protein [Syntrophomonadaceae bacterium]